jgi:RimJ/RimL family protein N-acetyltransferase
MTTLATARGPVTIRPASPADADRLRALRTEAVTLHPTSFGSTPDEVKSYDWRDLTGGGGRESAVFVVEHDGEFIALTGIVRSSRVKDAHHADVWGVYVREGWRKLGIAQALVNRAVDWAAARGVAIVKLTVVPQSGAQGCYERCGFRATGIDRAALKWKDRYYDEVLMSRWIGDEPRDA